MTLKACSHTNRTGRQTDRLVGRQAGGGRQGRQEVGWQVGTQAGGEQTVVAGRQAKRAGQTAVKVEDKLEARQEGGR